MDSYQKEITEEEFEEILNSKYGEVEICGEFFDSGTALKNLGDGSFDNLLSDERDSQKWVCGICSSEHGYEEYADDCCAYMCPVCEQHYDRELDAEDCCDE